jgi:hypothetical protein
MGKDTFRTTNSIAESPIRPVCGVSDVFVNRDSALGTGEGGLARQGGRAVLQRRCRHQAHFRPLRYTFSGTTKGAR